MYTFPSDPGTRSGPDRPSGPSLARMICYGIAICVGIALLTGLAFWLFSFIFHLAELAIQVALVVAVAAVVWRVVTGHRRRRCDI